MDAKVNPKPWIRAVFTVGWLGGVIAAAGYLGIHLGFLTVMQAGPVTLLGGFLGLGLLGAMTGGIAGFGTKLLLEPWTGSEKGWWAALGASVLASAGVTVAILASAAALLRFGE
jgi:hypothetical protein